MTESPPRRRRWLWAMVALVLLVVSAPPAAYLFVRWQGDRELAAVRAKLDADDPDWQLPELMAARDAALRRLPVNSADTVSAAVKLLPEGWDRILDEDKWLGEAPLNRRPTAEDLARLREARAKAAPTLEAARALRDQPDGGGIADVRDSRNYAINLNLAPIQERRTLTQALNVAAAVAALDDDPPAAVDAVRAELNVARSIGDEPLLISQLVRMACAQMAVRSAERVLGLSQPDAGLAELQAAFEREDDGRFMRAGLRGERASVDQVMTNIRAGTVGGAAVGAPGGQALNPFWPHDHAASLRYLTAAVEDAGRPPHQRQAADRAEQELAALPRMKSMMSRLLAPAVSKCLEADTRCRAAVQVAAVGLACERYRRAAGRWPDALAELPKDLLRAVPADPFDGQPLRYKRTADGAVVYSVGLNKADDGGTPGLANQGDLVFRLYDPDQRRLLALPPAPKPDDEP